MVSLFYILCWTFAVVQLSSAQLLAPGARNFGSSIGNIMTNNNGRNFGNLNPSGIGFGGRGTPGTLIATNDASSNSGKVSGTIGTRIVPANFEFGNLRSRLNKDFGLQVAAEGLEVEGKLAVNGRMPLMATVEVNGNVPSEGSASVNYACGNGVGFGSKQ